MPICRYFISGHCKFGYNCKYIHCQETKNKLPKAKDFFDNYIADKNLIFYENLEKKLIYILNTRLNKKTDEIQSSCNFIDVDLPELINYEDDSNEFLDILIFLLKRKIYHLTQ